MPPGQQTKRFRNGNMQHHKINEPQKVPYGVVQRDKYHICLWNNVRHDKESGMQKHLGEQYNSRQKGREGTEILLNHRFSICGFLSGSWNWWLVGTLENLLCLCFNMVSIDKVTFWEKLKRWICINIFIGWDNARIATCFYKSSSWRNIIKGKCEPATETFIPSLEIDFLGGHNC